MQSGLHIAKNGIWSKSDKRTQSLNAFIIHNEMIILSPIHTTTVELNNDLSNSYVILRENCIAHLYFIHALYAQRKDFVTLYTCSNLKK